MSATTSTTIGRPPGIQDVAVEELRFAGVLNGGVSLAVWMGGVAHELNRLTWSPHEDEAGVTGVPGADYAHVLRAARTRAIVDVLAGTSAGGINGGALALAQLNQDADLSVLRELWSEQGRMMSLLRTPFQGAPNSLLRGDDYFLPELHAAMTGLAREGVPPGAGRCGRTGRRVDLLMPTTLLDGWTRETPDAYGHLMRSQEHGGSLLFHLDDATDPAAHAPGIALASRASAGFPFAFEPTLLPVGVDAPDAVDEPLRPDLTASASWSAGPGSPRTRWAIDGGVLANTPTRQALDLIEQRGVNGPVRRLMLLVFPHAAQTTEERRVDPATPPTVVDTASGLFAALRSQGSLTFAEEIDQHNRQVGAWRGGREDVLASCTGPTDLYRLVRIGWPAYRRLRRRVAADSLAQHVVRTDWSFTRVRQEALHAQETADRDGRLGYVPPAPPPSGTSLRCETGTMPTTWRWGPNVALEVVDLVADVLRRALSVSRGEHGDVVAPGSTGPAGTAWTGGGGERARLTQGRQDLAAIREKVLAVLADIDEPWERDHAARLAPTAAYWRARLIALRLALGSSDPPPPAPGSAESLGERAGWSAEQWAVQDRKDLEDAMAEAYRACDPPATFDPTDPWFLELSGRGGAQGRSLGALVWEAVRVLLDEPEPASPGHRLLDLVLAVAAEGRGRFVGLDAWEPFLDLGDDRIQEPPDPTTGQPDPDLVEPTNETSRLLMRLLAIDTATWLVASGHSTGNNLPIDLVQLDLSVRHPWARHSRSPEDKAAGLSVGRFGGFLKRSWRLNDWIWGRLDAAALLCEAALDPDRLLRIHQIVRGTQAGGHVCDEACAAAAAEETVAILASAWGPSTATTDHDAGNRATMREAAVTALHELYLSGTAGARRLNAVTDFAALPLQWRIVLEELPHLRRAIEADRLDGQNERSRGELFLVQEAALLALVGDPANAADWRSLGPRALAAFDRAGIGREEISTEAGSDALIQTVATAAGVGITLLDSPRLGIPAVRPVTRALRGAAQLPYWALRGLTSGGRLARALAIVGLVVGGVLLVLGLIGALGSWSAAGAGVGAATLMATFAYGALRTGSLLHGLVLVWPLPPLLVLAASGGAGADAAGAAVTVGVVLAVVAGLVVVGSLPHPMRSPAAVGAERRAALVAIGGWRLGGLVVLVAVAGVTLWWVATRDLSWFEGLEVSVTAHPGWLGGGLVLAFVVLALVAGARGDHHGRGLRLWDESACSTTRRPRQRQVVHPAGVSAGWSAVYGLIVLLLGALLVLVRSVLLDRLPDTEQSTTDLVITVGVWWSVVLGLALTLVGPGRIARSAWTEIEHRLADSPGSPGSLRTEQQLVDTLRARGLLFVGLVECRSDPIELVDPTDRPAGPRSEWLTLTRAGRRLLARLRAATAVEGGRPVSTTSPSSRGPMT